MSPLIKSAFAPTPPEAHLLVRQWRTINPWNSSNRTFEKQVDGLLSDDEFALFQGFLFSNPKAGAVIKETGGLRKVRWAIKGKGKSGGVRVIYFYVTAAAQIRLIAIYKKGVKDDLNAAEKKVLKKLNENW